MISIASSIKGKQIKIHDVLIILFITLYIYMSHFVITDYYQKGQQSFEYIFDSFNNECYLIVRVFTC